MKAKNPSALVKYWRSEARKHQKTANGYMNFDEMTRVRAGDVAESLRRCADELAAPLEGKPE